jgi:GNAT superfamily N-acetyltransferase
MQVWTRPPFLVSTDKAKLNIEAIHGFLRTTYWSPDIPRDFVERAIEHSLCFGLFHEADQIGFARIVSDRSSFAYLADVFVLAAWRGRGLSKFLMECVRSHPELQNLRRWLLATADAHGLYEQFGFKPIAKPDRLMEVVEPNVYLRIQQERTQ